MTAPRALLVFAKAPKAGCVKTRLMEVVSPEDAADLHAACIADTLRLAGSERGVDVLWFVAGGQSYFRRLLKTTPGSGNGKIFAQQGHDLGARLQHAFRKTFQAGYREIVVVGTDSPWMGATRLRAAFAALRTSDVVIGPAEDGGYYLLGLRHAVPGVFRGIPWSTQDVLKTTLCVALHAKLQVKLLRRDFDLDRPQDLQKARQLLKRRPRLAPALATALRKSDRV